MGKPTLDSGQSRTFLYGNKNNTHFNPLDLFSLNRCGGFLSADY